MKNTKKFLSFSLVFIFIFSAFSIRVNGKNTDLIITEDYENVYLDSENYIKIDGIHLEESYPTAIEAEFKPLEAQKDIFKSIEIKSNLKKTVLKITFYFSNGDIKTSYYIHNLNKSEYDFAFKQPYSINFNDADESLSITKEDIEKETLLGEKVIINKNSIRAEEFHKIVSKRGDFTIIIGFIILDENGNFYYSDCEISKKYSPSEINNNYSDEIFSIKLSNSELLSEIKEAYYESLNKTEYTFDKFTSVIILAFFFLLLPLITLIISIIAKVKSKKEAYKQMWTVALIFSVAEIILFFITAFIILN